MIVISDVHKRYGPTHVLRGCSATVKQGEVVLLPVEVVQFAVG